MLFVIICTFSLHLNFSREYMHLLAYQLSYLFLVKTEKMAKLQRETDVANVLSQMSQLVQYPHENGNLTGKRVVVIWVTYLVVKVGRYYFTLVVQIRGKTSDRHL